MTLNARHSVRPFPFLEADHETSLRHRPWLANPGRAMCQLDSMRGPPSGRMPVPGPRPGNMKKAPAPPQKTDPKTEPPPSGNAKDSPPGGRVQQRLQDLYQAELDRRAARRREQVKVADLS